MKFFKFLCTILCSLTAVPGFSEWVLLDRKQNNSISSVEFIDFTSTGYNNYLIVIDSIEPLNALANGVMQFSNDGGNTWSSSYDGGLTVMHPTTGTLLFSPSDSHGIPLTYVEHAADNFIGKIYLSNVRLNDYGSFSCVGRGKSGQDSVAVFSGAATNLSEIDSVRFISSDPQNHPLFSNISATLYGLQQQE